jgi:hypothetical protein
VDDIPDCLVLDDLIHDSFGNKTCCQDTRLSCDLNFRVTSINFKVYKTQYAFTKGLPESIGQLDQLTVLSISATHQSGVPVGGPLPDSLGNLANLVTLSCNHCYLTGQIPSTMGNMEKLASINLGRNLLSGPLPSTLGDLSGLTSCSVLSNPDLCRAESFTTCGTDIPSMIIMFNV